jgi:hypothetical protein
MTSQEGITHGASVGTSELVVKNPMLLRLHKAQAAGKAVEWTADAW